MRFHRNLVDAVLDGVDQIFNQGKYADKVVEQLLKRDRRWGSRDRGFIAETLYELVRYKRLYAAIAGVKKPFSREDAARLFAVWAVLKGHNLPPWDLFEGTPVRRIRGMYDTFKNQRKYRESVPDWLDALGAEALGVPLWEEELHALNEPAAVVLRVNTLKTDREALAKALRAEGIDTFVPEGYPDALQLKSRTNIFRTKPFREGWFEVQDASSQKVARLLDVAPGMRVVDGCAGAGGKTLHLASLMENKGQLLALDIYENKLQELRKRARRAGAFNIETRVLSTGKPLKRLTGTADRVLIDAPCTGLGVLRRNPDAKWKIRPDFIEEVTRTQQELLKRYSRLLKEGGKMVYATCSILPEENQKQVSDFLASEEGRGFALKTELTEYASRSGYDGFYMALLEREG